MTDQQRADHYRQELKRQKAHDRAVFKTYDEKRLEELRAESSQNKRG